MAAQALGKIGAVKASDTKEAVPLLIALLKSASASSVLTQATQSSAASRSACHATARRRLLETVPAGTAAFPRTSG